jgi:hypothetical protein
LGIDTCSSLTWSIPGLEFDASNDTLIGEVSADYTGNGGDSKMFAITFEDGNTTSNPYTDTDLTDPSNNRNGTFSYSVAAVPEPSSLLLVASVLGLVALAVALRNRSLLRAKP